MESDSHTPRFLASGRISLGAIRERVYDQLTAADKAPDAELREQLRDVINYVLTVEGITLAREDRLALVDYLYRELTGFGPLHMLIADPEVTEISIDGPERVHVRRGVGEMKSEEGTYFEDARHLERITERFLAQAGVALKLGEPILEVGGILGRRPARLTVTSPAFSPQLHVEIRLHPAEAVTLQQLETSGLLDPAAAALLSSVVAARHGLMIAGDADTGKTTLLEALLPLLPAERTVVVERAEELRLPDGMARLVAVPPVPFAEQIGAALAEQPARLVLDEVRFDEAPTMWQALTAESRPHCLWAFRASTEPMRLRAAFSMSVRRAVPGIGQEFIASALIERLPFVVLLARQHGQRSVVAVSEWQPDPQQPDTPMLVSIWPGGATPSHALD